MKNFILVCILVFSFSNCSNEKPKESPDMEYNFENVRVLVPREYQKINSKEEVKAKLFTDKNSIDAQDQLLLDRVFVLQKEDNHFFAKYENEQLNFITFKTNGSYQIMNNETKDYILQQYESLLEENVSTNDSTYRFKRLENKLKGANAVRFLKYKYTHQEKDTKWYSTNYLITSNNRTMSMSYFSLKEQALDFENYMQFIQIK